eukprot:scaffold1558_cov403-Prasinococcus_capsulatus_cf.AAC.23
MESTIEAAKTFFTDPLPLYVMTDEKDPAVLSELSSRLRKQTAIVKVVLESEQVSLANLRYQEKDNYLIYTVGKVLIERAAAAITTFKQGGGWWLPGNVVHTLCAKRTRRMASMDRG